MTLTVEEAATVLVAIQVQDEHSPHEIALVRKIIEFYEFPDEGFPEQFRKVA